MISYFSILIHTNRHRRRPRSHLIIKSPPSSIFSDSEATVKMNDTDVSQQIQQMVRFIRQEAEEKANEISVSAEEVPYHFSLLSIFFHFHFSIPINLSISSFKPLFSSDHHWFLHNHVCFGWFFIDLILFVHCFRVGIQHREVAVGWSRQEEDPPRVRAQREASWCSQKDVTTLTHSYVFYIFNFSSISKFEIFTCLFDRFTMLK